jgi:hypothetical protein
MIPAPRPLRLYQRGISLLEELNGDSNRSASWQAQR